MPALSRRSLLRHAVVVGGAAAGSPRGVIGFGDRAAIMLPGGLPVWQQPSRLPGLPVTSSQFPWRLADAPPSAYSASHRPPTSEIGAQGYGGTAHGWDDQYAAWFGGWMNGWQFATGGPTTLGYLDRTTPLASRVSTR